MNELLPDVNKEIHVTTIRLKTQSDLCMYKCDTSIFITA
jgi:hypothetical protein